MLLPTCRLPRSFLRQVEQCDGLGLLCCCQVGGLDSGLLQQCDVCNR